MGYITYKIFHHRQDKDVTSCNMTIGNTEPDPVYAVRLTSFSSSRTVGDVFEVYWTTEGEVKGAKLLRVIQTGELVPIQG